MIVGNSGYTVLLVSMIPDLHHITLKCSREDYGIA